MENTSLRRSSRTTARPDNYASDTASTAGRRTTSKGKKTAGIPTKQSSKTAITLNPDDNQEEILDFIRESRRRRAEADGLQGPSTSGGRDAFSKTTAPRRAISRSRSESGIPRNTG